MYTVPIKKLKVILFAVFLLVFLQLLGVFHHPFEKDFYDEFRYPYDGDLEPLIEKLKHNQTPEVSPINSYNFYYYKNCDTKCKDLTDLRIIYLVKSAPQNFHRRLAIRSSWGFQRRFSDVEIRTVFLIGLQNVANLQISINEESQRFNDIVQANYTDSYYNNTYKTMSGFEWAVKYCPNAKFYMFMDDDFYISTKNVLRFLRFPTNYPKYLQEPFGLIGQRRALWDLEFELEENVRLYTGYVFKSAPHRHLMSKWYVSLDEYPYHLWPPYSSGGAYILSNAALKDMYYASFYTKHFRFDDIYVGILAYKTKIEPLHCEEFYFHKKPYYKFNYEYVIASHGYEDPKELVNVWNEQKSLGNA
ncbi:unnamed protein product [Ceutorhynchus assimilis]|uniref:Hexosyltransferase n=1 Tax=Ceutorhynchus assimilis TaxID=467358 RepID=A0A9N9MWQ2_9CUCU|nr:unnamed protein product [Ceutorhynchus assimilis]